MKRIHEAFDAWRARRPDAVFLHESAREFSYAALGAWVDADRVAAVIFTSGTTGAPKGVPLTHPGLLHFGRVSAQSRALDAADRSYACLPMTHIFGLGTVLMASLHAGASLVLRQRFAPDDVFAA